MSKKQKLESLQQLGLLRASEVKQVQAALGKPVVRVAKGQVGWASVVVIAALGYASIAMWIGIAWKLSH
jgi:hypothetical protein